MLCVCVCVCVFVCVPVCVSKYVCKSGVFVIVYVCKLLY